MAALRASARYLLRDEVWLIQAEETVRVAHIVSVKMFLGPQKPFHYA